jgi:diguanylate cyclase (GGDEF)-like protein
MISGNDNDLVNEISKLLLDVMMLRKPPQVPERFASVNSLQTLHANLISLRDFLYAASGGDLSRQVLLKGYIGGALKTLQANLKHMTWQTKRVASGDFSQRIEFMGEFAQSFNAMVVQLDRTLAELVRKEAELSGTNADLLKEIAVRKNTEAALRNSEEAFKLLATTDPLTGLYNRRHFNALAEDEIGRVLRYERPLSIMIFDIDFFKQVNDTFGHTCGDRVLKGVADITREILRGTDFPARYGGEEFIVLLSETPVSGAAFVAEKLRKRIEDKTLPGENGIPPVTASFGVSDHLEVPDSKPLDIVLSEFIRTADLAMYASKNAGRNRVTVYDPDNAVQP